MRERMARSKFEIEPSANSQFQCKPICMHGRAFGRPNSRFRIAGWRRLCKDAGNPADVQLRITINNFSPHWSGLEPTLAPPIEFRHVSRERAHVPLTVRFSTPGVPLDRGGSGSCVHEHGR